MMRAQCDDRAVSLKQQPRRLQATPEQSRRMLNRMAQSKWCFRRLSQTRKGCAPSHVAPGFRWLQPCNRAGLAFPSRTLMHPRLTRAIAKYRQEFCHKNGLIELLDIPLTQGRYINGDRSPNYALQTVSILFARQAQKATEASIERCCQACTQRRGGRPAAQPLDAMHCLVPSIAATSKWAILPGAQSRMSPHERRLIEHAPPPLVHQGDASAPAAACSKIMKS